MQSDPHRIQAAVIKNDPDQLTSIPSDTQCPPSAHTKGEMIAELCRKINELSAKRKQYKNSEEIVRKRLKQSRLTYAEMLRKQSKLIISLEEQKNCLDRDERLLSEEKRIADQIPDEIEQLSVRLANLCSSQYMVDEPESAS